MREVRIKFDFDDASKKLDKKIAGTQSRLDAVGTPASDDLLRKQLQLQEVSLQLQRDEQFQKWRIQYGDWGARARQGAVVGQQMADGFAKAITGTRGTLATVLGSVGVGASFAGLAQSAGPQTSELLSGSFSMLSTEIALTTLPAIVEFSSWIQEGARYIRDMSDGAKSMLGTLITGTLTFVGIGIVGQQVISTFANLIIVSQNYAGTMTGKLMSGATKVAGAFALVGTAAMALQYALNYQANQVNSLQNQASQIQSTGTFSYAQFQQLSPELQQQLQGATSQQQVQQIASQALQQLQAQSGGLQQQAQQNAQGWQAFGSGANSPLAAMATFMPELAGFLSLANATNFGPQQLANQQAQGAMQPVAQNEFQQSMLEQLSATGVLPQQLTPEQRRRARLGRMVFGMGGFQSQQMDVSSIHDVVQREAVKDPLQQAREEQMERARQMFIQMVGNVSLQQIVNEIQALGTA